MAVKSSMVSVFALLMIAVLKEISAQCSTFNFTIQPPTTLDCNPYDTLPATPAWRLRTMCRAVRLSGSQTFEVNWFHRKRTGEIENLRRPEIWTNRGTEEDVYFGSQWTNRPYDESMLGDYWCQIVVTSQQPNLFLGISNIITINEPSAYTGRRCVGTQSVAETRCADLPPNSSTTISSTIGLADISGTTSSVMLPPSEIILSSTPHLQSTTVSLFISIAASSSSVDEHEITLTSPLTTSIVSTMSSIILAHPSTSQTHVDMTTSDTSDIIMSTISQLVLLPSAIGNTVSSNRNDSFLLMASLAALIMLLLIIILLIIIFILVYTKPRPKTAQVASHEDEHFTRSSSIRSSKHKLLQSETLTAFTTQEAPLNHCYSTINGSPERRPMSCAHIYDDMMNPAGPAPPVNTPPPQSSHFPHMYDEYEVPPSLKCYQSKKSVPPPPQFRKPGTKLKAGNSQVSQEWEHHNPTYMQPPPGLALWERC